MADPRLLSRRLRARMSRGVDPVTRSLVQAWVGAYAVVRDDLLAAVTAAAEAGPLSAADFRAGRLGASMNVASGLLFDLHRTTDFLTVQAIPEVTAGSAEVVSTYMAQRARPFGIDVNMLQPTTLDTIVRRTTQRIHSAVIPLSQSAEQALRRNLVKGVAAGSGPREVAARMVAETRGVFGGGMSRALNLARTELVDAHRAGAAAAWQANGQYVTGWRWSAKLDTRTCPACWAMHNTQHLPEDVMEAHQQCRCVPVPTLIWDDDSDDLGDPAKAFGSLSRPEQLQVMGRERLARLEDGSTRFADLAQRKGNAGWRHGHYATPVGSLPAKANPMEHLPPSVVPQGAVSGRYKTSAQGGRDGDYTTGLVLDSKKVRTRDREVADVLLDTHRKAGFPKPDLVISPPPDPGKPDRFADVRTKVAAGLDARPGPAGLFREVADIPGYRQMSVAERRAAARAFDRFAAVDPAALAGKRLLIVDDVVTSGAQVRSLRKAALAAGAADVHFVAIARAPSVRRRTPRRRATASTS